MCREKRSLVFLNLDENKREEEDGDASDQNLSWNQSLIYFIQCCCCLTFVFNLYIVRHVYKQMCQTRLPRDESSSSSNWIQPKQNTHTIFFLFLLRDSCLLRCASQSSLDESSQKIPRQRSTAGTYKNDAHTNRSFDTMNEMRKWVSKQVDDDYVD